MTIKEALSEVTKQHKWYLCVDKNGKQDLKEEARLRVTALRILNGTSKPDTMKKFFDQFGYDVQINMEVKRK